MSSPPVNPNARLQADVAACARSLKRIERDAKELQWADERPWRVETHIWTEQGYLVVDLHDLSVKLALRCVDQFIRHPPTSGAVCFVTGVGRHSLTPASLPQAVQSKLGKAAAQQDSWVMRMGGPGRVILVTDPEVAAAAAVSSLPKGFWLLVALIGLAAVVALGLDISRGCS